MRALDLIAEQRIQEALRAGQFDDLPGAGVPLELDDDLLIPEEIRCIYRVLKNAGFVPPEIESRRAISETRAVLSNLEPASDQYLRALRKLQYLDMELAEKRGFGLRADVAYRAQLLRRLSGE